MGIVKIIKKVLPDSILVMLGRMKQQTANKDYKELSTKEVFTKIYTEHVWGADGSNPASFFSGGGSHEKALIEPYITAVRKFISSLNKRPDVMDLGCGDFNIGSNISPLCNSYVACDIVDSLIEHNKKKFNDLNVDFRVFDLTAEKCDKVDIIFIRQVLQHLSNSDIQKGLQNAVPFCKYLIVTEHWPAKQNFTKNLDKPTGPGTRTGLQSGIDITAKPFSYHLKATCICEVEDMDGVIKTFVYEPV